MLQHAFFIFHACRRAVCCLLSSASMSCCLRPTKGSTCLRAWCNINHTHLWCHMQEREEGLDAERKQQVEGAFERGKQLGDRQAAVVTAALNLEIKVPLPAVCIT